MYERLTRVNIGKQRRQIYLESPIIRYLGILAVMPARSSFPDVPGSKFCHGNGLVKQKRKSEVV